MGVKDQKGVGSRFYFLNSKKLNFFKFEGVLSMYMKRKKIEVNGVEVCFYEWNVNNYILLIDIVKKFNINIDVVIQNWLWIVNVLDFLVFWELLYNLDFNQVNFEDFCCWVGVGGFFILLK